MNKKIISRNKLMMLFVLLFGLIFYKPITASANMNAENNPADGSENSYQQQIEINGRVTDAETGDPLPGVNIVVQGTTTGTTTDMDGNYSIEASADATLVFSFVGYQEKTVSVQSQEEINVALQQAVTELEEVVAVGYGTRERGELTGSVTDVDGASIEQMPAMNITKTLQGKMAGLVVSDRGGEPGQNDANLLIRGSHTLGNNSPLIVIDGVPRSGFGNLSPNDIEDISVLKDASAAIYGARAANGVIVIRTKRGEKGQEPQIRLNSSYGVSSFTRVPEMMSSWQFAKYRNEVEQRFGRSKHYTEEDLQKFKSGEFPRTHPNTDWYNETFKDFAPKSHHNLSVTGGSENIQYYFSGDYLQENGHYTSNDKVYNQYQIRSNIDAQVMEYLNLGFNLSGRLEEDHAPQGWTGFIFSRAQRTLPTEVAYYPNGLPAYSGEKGMTPIKINSDDSGWNEDKRKIFRSKLSFDLNMDWLTKGLELSGYGSFDFTMANGEEHNKPYTLWQYDTENDEYNKTLGYDQGVGNTMTLSQSNDVWRDELYHIRLSYDRSFGDHNLNTFVAYEQNESFWNMLSGYRRSLYSEEKVELFAGREKGRSVNGSSSVSGRVNYFGTVAYDYMRKYMLEFSLRRDGSFNFAEGKRFGIFPGVSLGWTISEESFMAGTNTWLDNLKLRASWAKMGNDRVPSFQYLTKYNFGDYYIFGKTPLYNEGMYVSNTPNPNITWEVSRTQNIGFDATLWDGMLSMNFDYFYEKRRQILITRSESVPGYTALELPDENLGKVDNSGIELQLNHQNEVGQLTYNVGGNLTYNHNEIVYMDEAKDIPAYREKEGHPMNSYVVYKTDGIFNTQEEIDNYPHLNGTKPGDLKYIDVNDDGEIDGDDRVRKYTSPTPELQFGFNTGVQYKGFELNLFFQGQSMASTLIQFTDLGNRPEYRFTNRWTEDNKDANYPRPYDANDNFNRESTFHLHDASFIRLKNMELAYDLGSTLIPQNNILKGFRIYLRGSNLWTLFDHMPYDSFDPEQTDQDARYYPQLTTITAGIDLRL